MDYSYNKTAMNDQGNPPPYSAGPPMGQSHYHPGPPGPPPVITQGPTYVHATVIPGTVPTMVPMVIGQQMGSKPSTFRCPSCNHEIVTRVEMRATLRTHLFAALLCLIGCWPCVCVPYCVDSCNNIDHYCPNCNSYIGTYMN